MKKSPIKHHIDGLMALLVFGVFAACVLVVLLTGAQAYRRLTDRDQAAYDQRTCMQYVAARVRQADSLDGIFIEDFGGVPALSLADGDYVTRVYCYNGYLMELYTDVFSDEFGPADGEPVMEAEAMTLSQSGRLLTVTLTDGNGETNVIRLCLRSGKEEAA